MPHHITIDQAERVVLTRESLQRSRWKDRQIARALTDSTLRRLQRNRYVLGAEWNDLWPESRHLLEVVAAFGEMRDGDAVASHDSGAAVWALPLYRHVPSEVHVTIPGGRHVPSRLGLRRHTDSLPNEDVTTVDGYRVTTLERTAFDLARTVSFEAAVAAADAALRRFAFVNGIYDVDAAQQWRDRMLARAARAVGARGVRQAVEVIGIADGRAESPAESVGRAQLIRLGFQRIGLQVVVRGPDGKRWWIDIEIEDAKTFLEVDGASKYKDEALRSGRSLDDVILEEKRREDWIRGTTQHRFVRADDKHVATPEALAARLAAFGIRIPG
ncbi:hypothetical protein K0817_007320 [Microbacterium sp. HD4P20]|uniref:hypothetical protein n=1 Tax=Microbacterium sp. HD4P20 TaxID=2864874 RepID=UPI001C642DB5|nr:hypothetical protein [Microbacterium sp. HD4P20]MCP2636378.1 hypothetical protein [Microbacterium sp. HD4P20]